VETLGTEIRSELIDELMETYVDWREECLAVQRAYERWSNALSLDREPAFIAYRAALDREEQAGVVYAGRIEWVADQAR
jgi:hypothetical protein